ncbi:MAG TPA: type II toxin-antitoxin system HicA family toxin [Pseudogracilibacillus sp.]|nr:type II toxin-antitoxin system HicA family toxin [Pseudogracilibacillus sp.]
MNFRKVKKILVENGWVHVRTKGSHFQFKKESINFLATVPIMVRIPFQSASLKTWKRDKPIYFK